ncbi:MAG TPA: putative DNA modification/repair radical SAM protein, partial [candidate division WOR-3 bacterium]|nr:putative DNA modification/repair radical SAM protein [candidate division WOR-3 bacterium]
TQFVVGASGERDIYILKRVGGLYTRTSISRVYYSAFLPVPGTPFEGKEPTPPLREHRLYQVDYLLRKYGFELDELVFSENGNLILDRDPKTVWAAKNRWFFPVEINSAGYEELIRVPGIGPKTARKIVKLRQIKKINSEEEFLKIGKGLQKSLPYITLNGQKPYSQRKKIVISTLF